jgi:hypothetical protein
MFLRPPSFGTFGTFANLWLIVPPSFVICPSSCFRDIIPATIIQPKHGGTPCLLNGLRLVPMVRPSM